MITKGANRCSISFTGGLNMVVFLRKKFSPTDIDIEAVTAHVKP